MTQERAAELLEISTKSVQNHEADVQTPTPLNLARMARVYRAPWLVNHYCMHVCPLGYGRELPTEDVDLKTLALEMGPVLGHPEQFRDAMLRMLEIAMDGVITDDEVDDYNAIVALLGRVQILVDKLQLYMQAHMQP